MWFDLNRFHIFALLTWQFIIFFASQMIFSIFSDFQKKWRCDNESAFTHNCSIYSSCKDSVDFEPGPDFLSIPAEFGWICDSASEKIRPLMNQVIFIGVLLGTISWGTMSDVLGRKPMVTAAFSLGLTMNFISGLVPTWKALLVIRFVLGFSIGGALVVGSTFVMEMLLPHQRMALRAFVNWGVARLIMTLLCFLFNDWRSASIICALFAAPGLFIIIFIFPESPNWLHHQGQTTEMVESEKQIARFAGVQYVPVRHAKIEHTKTFGEMIRTKGLLKRLLTLCCMWFSASICGYATDLYSSTISGNLYVNQILFSGLIAISKIILVIVDANFPKFSRRLLHQASQVVVIACFLVLFLSTLLYTPEEQILWLNLTISLVGTVFIEYTWDACYLCAVESIETPCRASAMGICSLVARIGAMLSPWLKHYSVGSEGWPPLIYLVVTVIGSINLVVSFLFLHETKDVNLDEVKMDDDSPEGSPMLLNGEKINELE